MTRPTIRLILLATALAAVACGGSPTPDEGPVVFVDAPTPGPRQAAVATLEPIPTPTPPPPTPVPTPPGPTPTPLAPPRGSSLRAASGTQQGAPSSYCWTGSRGCFDHPAPNQTTALTVKQRETVLLVLDADRAPNSETIRPFQGSNRADYPSQRVDPALENSLTLDLPPGDWNLDLCATWAGYGQPCWLFRLSVVEG